MESQKITYNTIELEVYFKTLKEEATNYTEIEINEVTHLNEPITEMFTDEQIEEIKLLID